MLFHFFLANNRIVPKGANIYITIFTMNRNEKYFKNPDEFMPERFLGEHTMEKRNAFAYIPFSAGPRNCIGLYFNDNSCALCKHFNAHI